MSTLTFDTLKFANQLKTAGVPAIQAEAEAKALSEIFETNLSELVTKEDLRHEMSSMKFELLKWIIGLAIAQAGLLIGLLSLLLALLKFFPINS